MSCEVTLGRLGETLQCGSGDVVADEEAASTYGQRLGMTADAWMYARR
jgi:hypothetical protein